MERDREGGRFISPEMVKCKGRRQEQINHFYVKVCTSLHWINCFIDFEFTNLCFHSKCWAKFKIDYVAGAVVKHKVIYKTICPSSSRCSPRWNQLYWLSYLLCIRKNMLWVWLTKKTLFILTISYLFCIRKNMLGVWLTKNVIQTAMRSGCRFTKAFRR